MSTNDASYYTPLLTTSSTDTLFTTGETHQEVTTRDTALRIVYAVIGSLGILGNLTVCTVFVIRRRAFSSVTNKLILNQSCIDLLDSIVFLILRFGPKYLPKNRFGEFLCRFWYNEYIMWSLFVTSTFNLVFLSLERYFATCHPVKHRKLFSTKVPKIGIPCVWLAGFTYQTYWAAVQVFNLDGDYSCYPKWISKGVQMFMGIFLFTCEYLLPLSIMTFSYISIIMMLRRRTADRQKAAVSAFQKAKKNVTITLCLVFISYVVCWTPTEVTYLLYNLGYPYDFTSTVHDVVVVVVLCNMIINPIIYAFKYQHFQKQFRKVFFVCCGKNKVGDSNIASVTVDPAGADTSIDVG
ncbi:galanin receptor 2a-like [Amphiura filiformis]|uniref:galanin receptor 2a-like n=1 Tax=Amphiura filiformis TaxID=82378 RepID=UPI003B22117F